MKVLLVWMMVGWTSVILADEAAQVAEIRTWYNTIQEGRASGEKKIEFQAEKASLGGEVIIRDYADGLKAITISYRAGDHGSADEHFYYRKGILFFVFLEQSHWRLTDELDAEGVPVIQDTRVEQRIFLADGFFFRILRRKATGKRTENVEKLIAEVGQKKVEAGDGTAEYIQRGRGLLAAKTDAEVLTVFGPDYVPAK